MVEENDLDDEEILIVFEEDIKRKETKLVDSGILEQNPTLFEDKSVENGQRNEGVAEFGKIPLSENLSSLEYLIQMETGKKLQEEEDENEWRRFEEMNKEENGKNREMKKKTGNIRWKKTLQKKMK